MAARAAWSELIASREDMKKKGERRAGLDEGTRQTRYCSCGRPYHVDPEIHHGIPDLITSYGFAVLRRMRCPIWAGRTPPCSDRSVDVPLPSVCSGKLCKDPDNLDLIQLNSFGCGLDAVTTDQVSDILTPSGKIYTVLKIDEVNNLGAARIRIRSLIAALRVRDQKHYQRKVVSSAYNRVLFTKEMKKDYTILCPRCPPSILTS